MEILSSPSHWRFPVALQQRTLLSSGLHRAHRLRYVGAGCHCCLCIREGGGGRDVSRSSLSTGDGFPVSAWEALSCHLFSRAQTFCSSALNPWGQLKAGFPRECWGLGRGVGVLF